MNKALIGIGAILGIVAALVALPIVVIMSDQANANANTCDGKLQAADGSPASPGQAVVVPIAPHGDQNTASWTPEQVKNAQIITQTAVTAHLPPRAAVIAVVAAIVRSNLDTTKISPSGWYGLYLMPAGDNGGWGPIEQLKDPIASTTRFYTELQQVKDWQTIAIEQAIHATIQIDTPAGGDKDQQLAALYAPWEQAAGALVSTNWSQNATTSTAVNCGGQTNAYGLSDAVPPQFRQWVLKAGSMCAEAPPALIAAQIEQESGWNPQAVSPAGAQGISQFMPGTWATEKVDADGNGTADPFDPADAIVTQGKYDCEIATTIRGYVQAGQASGPISDLMLAGYNAGPEAVQAAHGIPPIPETQSYVQTIDALIPKYSVKTPSGGGSGPDPVAAFTTTNPRTPAQAIDAARRAQGTTGWYRMCDAFVAAAYGWGSSGSATANDHWQAAVNAGMAHPGDDAPPPGALLFYANSDDAGHVALYLGGDQVATNDIRTNGMISIVSRSDLTNGPWRLPYRGWAEPYFPGAGGTSPF